MKEIKLSNSDKVALVDDCDYDIVSMFNWHVHHGYAQRQQVFDGKREIILLHRFIWYLHNGVPEGEYIIDHIDRNRLNDSLSNLRLATKDGNAQNHGMQKNNKSGYKGVHHEKYFDKRINGYREYWNAQWGVNGKQKHKRFPFTEEGKIQAAKFRDRMVLKLYGEFVGYLNFPDEND